MIGVTLGAYIADSKVGLDQENLGQFDADAKKSNISGSLNWQYLGALLFSRSTSDSIGVCR